MNPEEFASSTSGNVIRTVQGYWAFVPNPLPPPIEYDHEVVHLISEADRGLGRLAGIGQLLPNPHLLIAPYVRREAVLSSRIEGT
ncbi:MAG TPA: Fic/DOC family N-terminal domain-containing protein, partial [Candidatus Methylomirabilis sp.]|nr:Fic/DOC family N-terminal domain-containing protein [Candidatus Methylomirabilis sp.]